MEQKIGLIESQYKALRKMFNEYSNKVNQTINNLEKPNEMIDPMGIYLVYSENNHNGCWHNIERYFDKFSFESYHRVYNFMGNIVTQKEYQIVKTKSVIKVVSNRYGEDSILSYQWHPYYKLDDPCLPKDEILSGYGIFELSQDELQNAMIKNLKPFYYGNNKTTIDYIKEELIKDFQKIFVKLSPYLNFTATVQKENKIYTGISGLNNEGPRLYFGYSKSHFFGSEIMFSNHAETLAEFCNEVYEMKKNTYCIQKLSQYTDQEDQITFYHKNENSDFVLCSASDIIERRVDLEINQRKNILLLKKEIEHMHQCLGTLNDSLTKIKDYDNILEDQDPFNSQNKYLPEKKYTKHI